MARRRTPEQPPLPLDGLDPWKNDKVREEIRTYAKAHSDQRFDEDVFDDYVNTYTGFGDWTQDKMYAGSQFGPGFAVQFISSVMAENLWRGSDLGGRVVESVPGEMTREGWTINVQLEEDKQEDDGEGKHSEEPDDGEKKVDAFPPPGGAPPPAAAGAGFGLPPPKPRMPPIDDEGQEISEGIDGDLERVGALAALTTGLEYERAFGGAAILIGADDGARDLSTPLNEENITSIEWLNPLQGGYDGEVVAWSYYRDPSSPKYGMPEIYMVRNLGVPITKVPVPGAPPPKDERSMLLPKGPAGTVGPLLFWVHESRLLVFPGKAPSRRARVQMRGWGDSIFTRVNTVLSQFGQTWSGVANLMSGFVQDVLKVQTNQTAMSMGDKKTKGNPLTNRARTIQQTKSMARMLVIGMDEEFDRKAAAVAGVADVLDKFMLRLAAAADMPVTLLMGQAPAGLNATGASDIRFFYDRIASRQKLQLLPQLKRLVRLLMLAKEGPTKGKEPERWSVEFNPLYQLTDTEEAQRRKTVAETDQIYINAGVVEPEEVAASRYGGSKYSPETTLDLEGRAQMAEQDAKDREAKQKLMSESAKVGVPPHQLPLDHPEHPNNSTPPEPPPGKPQEK